MYKLPLNQCGYITHFLVSGPRLTPFTSDHHDENQIAYEKSLRSIVAAPLPFDFSLPVKLNEDSQLSLPWSYNYEYHNWFIDKSFFYSTLTKVEMLAAVDLYVNQEVTVTVDLWTYCHAAVWVNKQQVHQGQAPVYKPIRQSRMSWQLKPGINEIRIYIQNLGCRDTRNILGLQVQTNRDDIMVCLPDSAKTTELLQLEQWMEKIILSGQKLCLPPNAPAPVFMEELCISDSATREQEIKKQHFTLHATLHGQRLERPFECLALCRPNYPDSAVYPTGSDKMYREIAALEAMDRGSNTRFSLFNVLARYHTGQVTEKDEQLILESLNQINERYDCSDFLLCALVRLLYYYPLRPEIQEAAKKVLLDYRYWMDQTGSDAMCFWSENHALMFYISAYAIGLYYPEEYFQRAQKNGAELAKEANTRILEWLEDIEKDGFEEFLSAGYMCVTFGALLNVVDFGSGECSGRATALLDLLFEQLAKHCFHGSVIAPQGRVYRDVIYPFGQGVQSLIYILDQNAPYQCSEWVILLATSRYQLPYETTRFMQEDLSLQYHLGNADIHLTKTNDYLVTSVSSLAENKRRWISTPSLSHYAAVKSLNECYHGTTNFRPGVFGYQQHMWTAALDNDTVVFVNHPGGTCDKSSMRPGYWYGNGIMPAVRQQGAMVGSIYNIAADYPISFTHLYFPGARFENIVKTENWIFGCLKSGFLGVWCSSTLTEEDDLLSQCELRSYDPCIAYLCICGSKSLQSFDDFMKNSQNLAPVFDKTQLLLLAGSDYQLRYSPVFDETQVI